MKKTLLLLLSVFIFGAMIVYFGREDVYRVVTRITPAQIVLMTGLQLGTLFMSTYIWYDLLSLKSPGLSIVRVFGISLAGSFVESITPSVKIGGEALKVYLMKKETALDYSQLTAITLVSKFFSLLPFLLISFLTLLVAFFTIQLPLFIYAAFAVLAGMVLVLLMLFHVDRLPAFPLWSGRAKSQAPRHPFARAVHARITRMHLFLSDTSTQSKTLVTDTRKRLFLFGLSLIIWSLYPVKIYLVAGMLGYDLNLLVVILATYSAYLAGMVPLLPGGLATFEGTLALVLSYEGLAAYEAFSIALVARTFTYWIPLLISALAALYYIKTQSSSRMNPPEAICPFSAERR